MLHRTRLSRGPAVTAGASISVCFKGLGTYDYPSSFTWPPLLEDDADERGHGDSRPSAAPSEPPRGTAGSAEYRSHRRSPFSVLRSRQCRVGRCASGVLPASHNTGAAPFAGGGGHGLVACGHRLCCCSALFYPALPPYSSSSSAPPSTSTPPSSAEEGMWRVRDDFLWALKLADVERLLRATITEELYGRLLGVTGTKATVVLTCNDLLTAAQEYAEASSPEAALAAPDASLPAAIPYVARLLLNADEDNRIKWLQEESTAMEHRDYYARAPSLRALFVMWSAQQQQQRVRAAALSGGCGGIAASDLSHGDTTGADRRLATSSTARTPRFLIPPPTMEDIQLILMRMEERHVEVTMTDISAIAAIGATSAGTGTSIPSDEFWGAIVRHLQPLKLSQALKAYASTPFPPVNDGAASCDEALVLLHVLILSLLLRYTSAANAEVPPASTAPPPSAWTSSSTAPSTPDPANSKLLVPMAAFEAASAVIQLRRRLTTSCEGDDAAIRGSVHTPTPPSAVYEALLTLCDEVLKRVYGLAERSQLSATSPHLPALTTWLLREMVTSAACELHFKRLVDRSITEALIALEKSGLVNRSSMNLKVVVRQVLPLVESCGSEDLYTSVLNDVVSALEEKARRDRHAFTQEDMLYLAELGTKLFVSGSADSTAGSYGLFDQTARGQMEELHVMDGSPWALCVSTYRSLKEMMQGIIRDQRRLKQQVQEQLRQLSSSSTLSAVMTGSTEAQGRHHARLDGNGAPLSSPSSPPDSEASSVARGDAAVDLGAASAASDAAGEDGFTGAKAAVPCRGASASAPAPAPAGPPRISVSPMLRQRFLILIEELVKAQVAESSNDSERPIVVSTELFAFVTRHVPVPNIQDEYRRKIFLLVNVAEAPETTRRRLAERREKRRASADGEGFGRRRRRHARGDTSTSCAAEEEVEADGEDAHAGPGSKKAGAGNDPHGGANDIPAELRFLVSSLPLTLSPWASVMILREVLAESAGRNPRYTYVLNAAIDLQLPMSTTRSRIATTLNMWRFLNTQAHKLSLKESVMMKQRCAWNLPMSYVLSSYWSLLTWLFLASIIMLNVVGIDFESQLVANSLFRMFAPWEEICVPQTAAEDGDTWSTQAAADLASDYFEQAEIADRRREEHRLSSTDVFLSSASYLILGYDDQRRPMTVIPIGSDCTAPAEERIAEEYAAATAVLRELSLHAPFPFFVDIERPLPMEYVEKRIAERIRRVSFNNTWFLPRMIIRTFPLGRQYTEHKLVLHTCTQANLTRRRITFLLYMHDGVPVTPQFIQELSDSFLSRHANLVLVVHESSLLKGGTTPEALVKVGLSNTVRGPSATIASAAAEMIDAVLPSDLKDSPSPSAAASAAHHMRVLPYCRQYYSGSGSVIAGLQRMADGEPTEGGGGTAEKGWWVITLRSVRRLWERLQAGSGAASSASTAAASSARLPLFASTFSSRRTSLHRSRERQCKEAEEVAAANKQRQSSDGRMPAAAPWVNWWWHTLSGVTSATIRMVRVDCIGVWGEEAERDDEAARKSGTTIVTNEPAPHVRAAADQTATDTVATRAATDTAEAKAGKGGVSVSFTALRRLMSEV
ncbi:conserved hypothetical protein [Leishmania infantum JPCM5]|uniref:Uncharacterized protein n=2 Tax=Leishmania infantum TaxID=5671 RepID=A4I4D2_LEIIN|nr:conserved hypothetical protein [Leishmania infantum JPCM5]CAC9507643.1 hypothetical_protein_-_conserved [Leishmania infantum]CAM69640.1 conserved hypothetical protein [Leishmania infantum JPCM5]SUZ43579.1 hypothetical_protein_-_conserved [Leishmania infantum]|eukprot:XP_001466601.1 conserved hypothetical protein [Leishmania infantum JPCM5]